MATKGEPTPEQALFSIGQTSTTPLAVVMGGGRGDAQVVNRLQMTTAVEKEFRRVAENSSWWDSDDFAMRVYDPGYKPDERDVVYARVGDVPGLSELVQDIGSSASLEQFGATPEQVEALRFYAIVGGTSQNRTIWFRSYTKRHQLSQSVGFAIVQGTSSFNLVRDNILTFDDNIDCVVHDGFVFVADVGAFERVFDLKERRRAAAAASIDRIVGLKMIANGADFKNSCSRDLNMALKAVGIAGKSYFSKLSIDAVRKTVEHHQLPIEFDADGRMVFNKSPRTRWLILQVLADDYLDSMMTGMSYETNSKTPLSA